LRRSDGRHGRRRRARRTRAPRRRRLADADAAGAARDHLRCARRNRRAHRARRDSGARRRGRRALILRPIRWRVALRVLALAALAAALRFWALGFGLPQPMTRPDEEAIRTVAARIVLRSPNPQFFDYPTLFMYLVAAVEKIWPGPAVALVNDDVLPTMIPRT